MTRIAVIGFAGRFPGAPDVDTFWANLLEGRESISRFTPGELTEAGVPEPEHAQADYVAARGVVADADCFDAEFFGYSAGEAMLTDPQQRVLLECAWHAAEHAGYGAGDHRTGVFVGTGENSYLGLLAASGVLTSEDALRLALSNAKDHAATRIAYKLGLTGPAVAVQTACSTSLVAVHLAASSLRLGDCDLALAGGASIQFPQIEGYRYSPHGILSPDGRCRPFADDAHGTVPGSGAAVVVLKRLDEALADGDTVHAVIRGSAVNNDGSRKAGYTAPSPHGQRDVILRALDAAEVDPATIGYVEAHGTGTEMGDGIEVQALTEAFGVHTDLREYCALGSVKSNVGHLDAAAGVTGLIKAVLAVREGVIPRSLHCEVPHRAIAWGETPFVPARGTTEWPVAVAPRRAAVSASGMGGTNAHVILEQAPADARPQPRLRPRDERALEVPALIPLSGAGETAVAELRDALAKQLAGTGVNLADAAHTLRVGRAAQPWRIAVAGSAHDLPALLRAAVARKYARGTLGFLFPGQGTQHPGMAEDLYEAFPVFRERFDECMSGFDPSLASTLRTLMLRRSTNEEDRASLNRTRLAQPALFALEYSVCGQLEFWGMRPRLLLGHSVGEITAACVAGAFTLAEALRLVEARGRLMDALPGGSMLAVFAGEAETTALLPRGLQIAAVNGPRSCVVAGPTPQVGAFAEDAAARGVSTRRLRVSHAFHSAMMAPAVDAFRTVAEAVHYRRPSTRVISNLTGEPVREYSARYWVEHLLSPVRFADGLATVLAARRPVLIEVGPGRSLGRLAQEIDPAASDRFLSALPAAEADASAAVSLLQAVGSAWATGVEVDWSAFGAGRRIPLPLYPFDRRRHWPQDTHDEGRLTDRPSAADPTGAARPTPQAGAAAEDTARNAAEDAAEDEIESLLRATWHTLLAVTVDEPDADFFALGGDSLLAVRLLATIRRGLDLRPTLDQILNRRTFAAQVELLRGLQAAVPTTAGRESGPTTNTGGS